MKNETFIDWCDSLAESWKFDDAAFTIDTVEKLIGEDKLFEFLEEAAKLYISPINIELAGLYAHNEIKRLNYELELAKNKIKEAWDEGYNDGCNDAQSYNAGYPQKAKNPYSK